MSLVDGGPRVVALGGGHGLAASLRAARRYAGELTAVVSVADDGGSSGRLREALGIPAPGDVRRCLVALGDERSVWARSFEHRFESGDLAGHAVGNLVIAGLAAATGNFSGALGEAARLVGCVGRVLPATDLPVDLVADTAGGTVVGQVGVGAAEGIRSLSIVPADAPAGAGVTEAIGRADQVLLGPGSLFTSVLAAAVVDEIRSALATTPGRLVYICNLRPQTPESTGFDVADHVSALARHGIRVDDVLCHDGALKTGDLVACGRSGAPPRVTSRDLARPHGLAHDPARLATALTDLVG